MTLLRSRWVAGHLLVLVLSASFIALGFWQLARNDHKQRHLVRDARAAFAAPAPDVSGPVPPGSRVQASGHYDPAHEVLLRNQVHDGNDGDDVLTPPFSSKLGRDRRSRLDYPTGDPPSPPPPGSEPGR